MKMSAKLLVILFCVAFTLQNSHAQTNWNGYVQFRFNATDASTAGFSVRRAKAWLNGEVPGAEKLYYKVMGIFKYNGSGSFGLLDVYGEYRFGNGFVRFGQQIPEFSLQRFQPDWRIPVVERAKVIDALIPAAESSARDIGVQFNWQPIPSKLNLYLGVFNGNGANVNNKKTFKLLYTFRSTYQIDFDKNSKLNFGFSLAYRKANKFELKKIFGKNRLFTGKDLRYGFETILTISKLIIQGEFIEAKLENEKANGFYVLSRLNISGRDQLVVGYEDYNDINSSTSDREWITAGYNRLLNEHKLKVMLAARAQLQGDYELISQIQLFFN